MITLGDLVHCGLKNDKHDRYFLFFSFSNPNDKRPVENSNLQLNSLSVCEMLFGQKSDQTLLESKRLDKEGYLDKHNLKTNYLKKRLGELMKE